MLFGDPLEGLETDEVGYRGPIACNAAGITYRQLDYWARTGLLQPSIRAARGSGSQRLYSFRDILVLKVVKKLLDAGVSLQQVRVAVASLQNRGVDDLASITLMSDGASVYECTSTDEVIDLLQGGQGVFGIAVGRVWREVEGSLAELPLERSERTFVDELAEVRRSVDVPIAADESIRRAEDPLEVARKEAADVVIIKVAPLGGVRSALRVARKCGLGVVVSSALETSVGLSIGVAAAAAVPGVPRAAGLATASLLVGDVTTPLVPERGRLPVGRLAPDLNLIGRGPEDSDLVSRWGMRLEGMAEHLEEVSR